jgi:hypothetical protein
MDDDAPPSDKRLRLSRSVRAGADAMASTATSSVGEGDTVVRIECTAASSGTTAGHAGTCATTAPSADTGQLAPPWGSGLTFVELFAGIGGFRVALERLGMRCVMASEIEGQARATYRLNWPASGRGAGAGSSVGGASDQQTRQHGHPSRRAPQQQDDVLLGDITALPDAAFPTHDLLCGGFPCQPFTRLGVQSGFEHQSGLLYREVDAWVGGWVVPRRGMHMRARVMPQLCTAVLR